LHENFEFCPKDSFGELRVLSARKSRHFPKPANPPDKFLVELPQRPDADIGGRGPFFRKPIAADCVFLRPVSGLAIHFQKDALWSHLDIRPFAHSLIHSLIQWKK
jgi:hypothetical protein